MPSASVDQLSLLPFAAGEIRNADDRRKRPGKGDAPPVTNSSQLQNNCEEYAQSDLADNTVQDPYDEVQMCVAAADDHGLVRIHDGSQEELTDHDPHIGLTQLANRVIVGENSEQLAGNENRAQDHDC